jgi:hypothetical protein
MLGLADATVLDTSGSGVLTLPSSGTSVDTGVVGTLPAGGSGFPTSSTLDAATQQNILNCGTSNCGALSPAPTNYNYTPSPTSAPFCGAGSTQWISGIDNCVLIGVGVVGLVIILAIPKGKRK